ncbi:MAG: UDP-glucose/GDP-mannose dehydrogenase family protein [Acidobacteria bacterium]|nr:MAG: UDP-glucose/GDP-mannose dehydrogenase family protein [Acidobacteriota bacterium]REK11646.1 MAG: UDP-glucose/GDP-mannose dehydrogenase family protein [Acidobacteriota bacterium]
MNICVVGSGYVGLVTGACLADFGMNVTCVDKDEGKIARLLDGEIPIYEPGLEVLVAKNRSRGRLHFSTDVGAGIDEALAIFIAVGTPPREDGSSDLTFVRQVAEAVASRLTSFKVVVTKSTVPIGTGQMIEKILRDGGGDSADFAVVSNPEFLREGSAIDDFLNPDRLVIGSRDERAISVMLDIYSPLRTADVPFVVTNVETAEMIKYASNSFLATKISFINEVAELCERLGADVEVVARGMGLDKRIGPQFLHPGPGFGGSCFPKDARALAHIAREQEMRFEIVETVMAVNERIKLRMIDKIEAATGGLPGRKIGVLGLSFKAETDDMRESAAIPIIQGLLQRGASVRAYDPAAMDTCRDLLPQIDYAADAYDCANGADVLVIVTEWNEFRKLELRRLSALMRRKVIVDLRNLYELEKLGEAGFAYHSIGRRPVGAGGTS